MKNTTLLILAAGIGSRYAGGVDFSVKYGIDAGFNRIVFVIRREIENEFREAIGKRAEKLCSEKEIALSYCFQDITDVPGEVPMGRKKLWGTGHAVLAAKNLIDGALCIVNADDYYAPETFVKMHDWLVEPHDDNTLCMMGFVLEDTLSYNSVSSRAICTMAEDGKHVEDIVETRGIIKTPAGPECGGELIDGDTIVALNMWGLPAGDEGAPRLIRVLEKNFKDFFDNQVIYDPLRSEYQLPTVIGSLVRKGRAEVEVIL